MRSRKERAGPVPDPAMAPSGIDRNEARKILVLGPEAITDPRTHAGPHKSVRASMQLQQGAAVRFIGPMHRLDETELVSESADLWKQVTDHRSALTVGAKFPGRGTQIPGLRKLDARLFERQRLSGIAGKGRLIIESVHVRRA